MTILTGDQIPEFRKRVLLRGLKLELKGMKLSRGRSCYSIIKSEFNLKGSRQSVFDQFSQLLNKGMVKNKMVTVRKIDND